MFKTEAKHSTIRATIKNIRYVVLTAVVLLGTLVAPVTGVFLFTRGGAHAATSSTLNFQARLLGSAGSVVPDGTYNLEFKLYDVASGGTALWTDTRYDQNGATAGLDYRVTVKAGYFSVNLADTTAGGTAFPSTIDWDQELWLGLNVGGSTQTATPTWDGEMTPRFKLTAVPYAFRAGVSLNVASSNTNTASTASNNVSVTSGNATGTTSNSGNVTIDSGTATGTAGSLLFGTANASALTIGRTGITTTLQGSVSLTGSGTALSVSNDATIGGTLGVTGLITASGGLTVTNGDTFTNAGATLNTAVAISNVAGGGAIGTAAGTVDAATTFSVNQTTASQTLSLPTPTNTAAGRIVYVNNVGSASFTMHGSVIAAGASNAFMWNGTSWVTTVSLSGTVVSSVGTIDSQTKSADGAVIASNAIYMQTADASFAGLVSTGTQTFAGAKTFNSSVTVGSSLSGSATALSITNNTSTGNILTLSDGATTVFTVADGGTTTITANGGTNVALIVNNDGSTGNILNLQDSGTNVVTVADGGAVLFKNTTNSTAAFQVQPSGSTTPVLNVDTSNSRVGVGTNAPNASLQVSGNQTAGGFSTGGIGLRVTAATYTDNTSAASSTQAIAVGTSLGIPTFAATNSNVTYTNAATLYISDAPTAGTNVTLTNRYALYVASGASIFGGSIQTSGGLTVTSGSNISQTGAGTFSTGTGTVSLNGAATASAGLTITSGGSFNTQRNTTDITAGGNDVNLGTGSLFRFTNGSPITLTGIANGADGRRVMLVNAGTSTVTLNNADTGSLAANRISTGTGSAVTLPAGGSLELIYDSGASLWRVTSASTVTGGYVQNQSSTDQSADFRITGTGRANTSITTPLVDSITGALSVGTSTATGITLGGTTNTSSIVVQGAAGATYTIGTSNNTGGITVGNSTASNTISIGAAAGAGATQTINVGTSATASSTTNVTIGSTIAGNTTLQSGTTNINSGTIATNQTTVNLLNTTATTVNAFGAATNITLGATSGTLTVRNANTTLGNAAGSGVLTNNGATVNTTLALTNFASGGSIGSAASTVDIYTSISINQTTASQTLTLPTPTASTTYGRTIFISNIGSTSFTMSGLTVSSGSTLQFVWSNSNGGASWQATNGGAGSFIQNQNGSDQSANFRITGTGRANTSFTTPALDSITGALTIGATTATGITLGNASTTSSLVLQGTTAATYTIGTTSGTGTITIGQSTDTNTISIGTANGINSTQTINIAGGTSAGSGGKVVNIANGLPGNSTTNTVNIANSGTSTGAVSVNIGSNGSGNHSLNLLAGGSGGQLNINTNGAPINIGTSAVAYTTTIGSTTTGSQVVIQAGTQVSLDTAAAGAVTIAGGQTTGTVTIGSTVQSGTITLGRASNASSTINIGAAAGNTYTQTINIGTSATGGSTTNVTIGSVVAGSTTLQSTTTNINSGTIVSNQNTVALLNTNTTTLNFAGAAGAITIGATSGTLTVRNANFTFGNAAGSGTFTNNGATFNTTLALGNFASGGAIGTAAATVDVYTSISVAQTTASQTLTIPTPTGSTNYGRTIFVSNIGTASFTIGGQSLNAGSTISFVWSNTNGGASWQANVGSLSASSFVQNQNSTDQSADFRISGTGRANTSITTPLVDSITGALSIGTSTATGVTIGGTTNTTSLVVRGAAAATYTIGTSNNTGGITLGNSTATNTISIGSAAGASGTQTINIGTSATASSTTNITLGSTIAGTTILQSGTTSVTGNLDVDSNTLYVDAANNDVIIGGTTGSTTGAALTINKTGTGWTQSDGGILLSSYTGFGQGYLGTDSNHPFLLYANSIDSFGIDASNLVFVGGNSSGASLASGLNDLLVQGNLEVKDKTLINGTVPNNAYDSLLSVTATSSSTTNDQRGGAIVNTVSPGSASTQNYAGLQGYVTTASTNVSGASLTGVLGQGANTGTGTVGTVIGVQGQLTGSAGGTISTGIGLYSNASSYGGTLTNYYGVKVENATSASNNTNLLIGTGTTGNWSIYSNSAYNSAINGSLRVGGLTAPTVALDVTGAGAFSTNLTVGSGAGVGQFTNNGSTVYTTLALTNFASGGAIGTAAATVDIYTSFSVNQTTASQTLTIPTPTASTTYGRRIQISNIGTTSFTISSSLIMPGNSADFIWSNTNGGASWQYAGDGGGSGSYIQNQNSADQTGNFRISGTGRANTSFTTPLVDSITGALSIGTSTATGVTISKSAATTAVAGALTVAENFTVDTNTLFVDANNNRAAIGTTDVTNGVLTVAGTAPNAANGAGIRVDTTLDSTSQNQNGLFIRPTVSPASASTRTYAALNFAAQSSSANVSGAALMGIFGGGSFSGTGTLGSAYGAYFQNYNNTTGTISDSYGVYIDNPSNAGTITRNYGQVIINQAAGGTANANLVLGNVPTTGNWSLYSQSAYNSAIAGSVRIGSTTAPTSTLDVTGTLTSSGGAINLNASSNFATNINTGTSTGAISIGNNTGNPTVTIDSGTGAISIGTGAQNRTTNIATGGAIQTVTIGSTNTTSATTIAAGSGAISFNATTAQFTEVTGTRTLTVQTRTTGATAGTSLTIAAGTAGATSTYSTGGVLTLQGGNAGGATGSAANGGNVVINGGTGAGGGVRGLVVLGTPAFQTATVQNFTSSASITQANIDANSAILISSNAAGYTATLGDPTITTAGRVIYVTNSGAFDMTLSVNGGGSGNTITLKPSTTATMIWNGADWTAAGASSSTDLQAAYNNTATSAGGAELVLNGVGGAADGLTVRNNATSPIIGGIFEAQTSVGSNIFSVNNNATEYAVNGGAETSTNFSTNWLAAPAGGTVARNTTAAEVATGQASVSVVTTATASHGARNILSATLTPNLRYNVSYTVKSATAGSSFTTLETMFSSDGTATAGNVRACVAGTPTYFTGTASQSTTTITGSGTTFTAAMVGSIFVFANGQSALITGYTNPTTLTTSAAYSQTVTSQSFGIYDSGNSVKAGAWSRVSCSFTAPSSGMTANNSIFIRQTDATARTFYIDNLSVTVSADANHAADGSVDNATNFTTNWTTFGTATIARNTSVLYDTSASASAVTSASANQGIRNNLSITPSVSTQYLVTFYARSSNTFNDIRVRYTRDGGTNFVTCGDMNTQTVSTTGFTRITCLFTTDSTTATNPDIVIDQPTATARTFYIDALTVSLNTNTSNNVQIGAGSRGGPITLFTLDRAASAPIAANNDAYLGSMYYDTTTGRIQCYEADGWGACGSAPDNYVNLNPEYAGAVLNGSGVGTMTADFCANQSGVLTVNTTLCSSGESRNYYRWTSPQASDQTYSIYVSYQLPATFKGFASDDTVQLTARTDNTTNGSVSYEMFKSESGALTACGTATTVTSIVNTWQTVGINGNEATSCNFTTASANAFVIFKINVTAKSNANVYVGTLSFTTTGR